MFTGSRSSSSSIKKKVVTPNDFGSLGQLSATPLGFVDRHDQAARAFCWTVTARDLRDLMDRAIWHEQQDAPHGGSLPPAA